MIRAAKTPTLMRSLGHILEAPRRSNGLVGGPEGAAVRLRLNVLRLVTNLSARHIPQQG